MSKRAERQALAAVRQRVADEARAPRTPQRVPRTPAPPRPRRHEGPPPAGPTVVEAYALRWHHVTRGGDGWLGRFLPGCFDGTRPTDASVLAEHGLRIDSDEPSDLLSEPVGEFTASHFDAVGLRLTTRYSDTPLARDIVTAIRGGGLTAYSAKVTVLERVDSGERRHGETVFNIVRAKLLDAGPTHNPADPGAVILSIGDERLRSAFVANAEPPECTSLDDAIAYLSSVSGLKITLDDVDDRHRRITQAARQQLNDADWLASQLGKARRAAEAAYRDSRASWGRPDDLRLARKCEAEADELEADLREHLYNNPAMIADAFARFRVPPRVSPLDRLKAAIK